MNSLNSSSVDAKARTAIVGVEREGEAKINVSKVGRAGADTLATGVVVFCLEGAELPERKIFRSHWRIL